jgi:hypothetical protein
VRRQLLNRWGADRVCGVIVLRAATGSVDVSALGANATPNTMGTDLATTNIDIASII